MNARTKVILSVIGLLGGCMAPSAQTPVSAKVQDIDFIRGCWVHRFSDGQAAFLRLLPAGPGGPLEGRFPAGKIASFATNGSAVTYTSPDGSRQVEPFLAPPPTARPPKMGSRRATFAIQAEPDRGELEAYEGDGDHLRILVFSPPLNFWTTFLEFERDGCD